MENNKEEMVNEEIENELQDNEPEEELAHEDEKEEKEKPDWNDEDFRNNKISGIRKQAEEKAYQRAYQDIMNQAQQMQDNNQPESGDNQVSVQQNQPNVQHALAQQNIMSSDAYGRSKYDDWDDKLSSLQPMAMRNPGVKDVIAVAAQLPNGHELIYKLSQDENALDDLSGVRPERLMQKLIKYNSSEEPKTTLVPRKPLTKQTGVSANGSSGELSNEEKRKKNLDRLRNKMS